MKLPDSRLKEINEALRDGLRVDFHLHIYGTFNYDVYRIESLKYNNLGDLEVTSYGEVFHACSLDRFIIRRN